MGLSVLQSAHCVVEPILGHWKLLDSRTDLVSHAELEHVIILNAVADFDAKDVDTLVDSRSQWHRGHFEINSEGNYVASHRH